MGSWAAPGATAGAFYTHPGGAVSISGRIGDAGVNRVISDVLIVARRPALSVVSVVGACLGVSSVILSFLSRAHLGIALTWGMAALLGLGMPVLAVLYVRDTTPRPNPNSATNSDLPNLP
jgi:hypothetical protein